MKKIIEKFKPYILHIVAVVALIYIQVVTDLSLPTYMSRIINEGIVAGDNNIIVSVGSQMLLATLIGALAVIVASYLGATVATGVARDLRSGVFEKVESFSLAEFDKFSTSSLITRTTNDIQQIQIVIFMTLRMVVLAPLMATGAIIKAYQTAPSLSWIMVLAIAILISVIAVIFTVAIPRFEIIQKLTDKLNLVTRERLTGMRVIRAFTTERYEENRFKKTNTALMNVNLFVNRLMSVLHPVLNLLFNLTTLGIVWFGAQLLDKTTLNIGDMMAFIQYAMQVIMSFLMLSMIFINLPRAFISIRRVGEVLSSKTTINDPKNPKKYSGNVRGKVEFKNVTFSYPNSDTPAIENVSFIANPGETTAIIGSTGSGKSTLINLIPRFYDATEGSILVNDINVKELTQKTLRKILGFVPQKTVLFSGTVESNIAYGLNKQDKESITRASEIAQARKFIEKMEGRFNASISRGGTNVSGGQKQRLAIARAIAKKPEIYIFDDSFSALDFKTDLALRQALEEETKDATVIVVTQRIGTVINADKIIVLEEGKVVGIGTHSELLATNKTYKEIAKSQLSEKELEQTVTQEGGKNK